MFSCRHVLCHVRPPRRPNKEVRRFGYCVIRRNDTRVLHMSKNLVVFA